MSTHKLSTLNPKLNPHAQVFFLERKLALMCSQAHIMKSALYIAFSLVAEVN